MLPRITMSLLLNLTLCMASPALGAVGESAEALSDQALSACQSGRVARDRDHRLAHFERAEALAERAIDTEDDLADAHFALFCGLGEQLRLDGGSLSSLFGLRRVLAELDRTLALDPNHLDALSAKGTLLLRLPGWLGGDRAEAERLLERVVDEEPLAINARLGLARVYAGHGQHGAAVEQATRALAAAEAQGRRDLIPEARATLAEVQPGDHEVVTTGFRGR